MVEKNRFKKLCYNSATTGSSVKPCWPSQCLISSPSMTVHCNPDCNPNPDECTRARTCTRWASLQYCVTSLDDVGVTQVSVRVRARVGVRVMWFGLQAILRNTITLSFRISLKLESVAGLRHRECRMAFHSGRGRARTGVNFCQGWS